MLDFEFKILKLLYKDGPQKVGKIAKKINMPHSTIGSSIKRLEEKQYVIYQRYNPVNLSEKGKDMAIELTRHARLLEILLINEFSVNPKVAHEECEKFNLLFSCDIINKICERYNHPKMCPCGEQISNSSDCYCERVLE
ncbi:MAG: metal-dependent transcriptional regulator [Promethearchaeota archaeon]